MEDMTEGRIWSKFHPVFGPDLKVGFETTFPKEVVLVDLDPLYEKSGLVHNPAQETVKRIYEPAVQVLGSCLDGDATQVFFEPVSHTVEGALFRRLVFTRKMDSGRPRCWMVAARHGEVTHFGFNSWNSKNPKYLSLAYPGLNEIFVPVYVKIQEQNNGRKEVVFLEVWAWDEEDGVVVQGRRVAENEVPESLLLAKA